jgi:two-component system, LytTR family, sensor kinase
LFSFVKSILEVEFLNMKKLLCIIIIFTKTLISFSQNVIDSIHPLFKGSLNDGHLIRENFLFLPADESSQQPGEPILTPGIFYSDKLTVQLTQEKFRELGIVNYDNNFTIPVLDSSGIIVTVNGINKENAANYQFRVLENKTKEKISWHDITLFCEPYLYSTKPDGTQETEVAYLGEFKTLFGNSLTIEIRKKGDTNTLKSVSAIWMNRAPLVLGIFSANDMQSFLSVFKKQWTQEFHFEPDPKKRLVNDSLLRTRNDFAPGQNSLIFYLDDVIKSKEVIEYNLVSGKRNSGWKPNDFDLNLIWLKNLSPGQYTLQIRYSLQRHNVSEYKFSIAPYWHQSSAFKIIAAIMLLIVLGLIVMLFKSRKQKQKLKWEQLQKQQMQTELKSIRSQFNPHFVFNALSSIQGLITKNDMEGANRYLNEFSTLLRDSLKESSNEMVSLFTEMKMLDSYLKLEQLRFGFTYSITTDATIDKNATEIPVLILQPLVENAVKHGISSLYNKGILSIEFKKSSADMQAIISDNGKGFNADETTKGYGMKLTRDRIALINKMLKGQSIELVINSAEKGTTVHLLFKNWLL